MPSDAVAALWQEELEGLDEAKTIPRQPPTRGPRKIGEFVGSGARKRLYIVLSKGGEPAMTALPLSRLRLRARHT